ncbi:MAG: hypothetical protein ACREEA_12015, partial [Stellaceae bacterium]
ISLSPLYGDQRSVFHLRHVMQVAAVTGLAAEARIARLLGLRAIIGGGDGVRCAAAIQRLLAEGAGGLVSFGICGGLDPRLASGTLMLPRAVRSEAGERWETDGAAYAVLSAALDRAGIAAARDDILGAAEIAGTAARKSALFRQSGACAIDLESHLVARAARSAGLPFVVLRAIADPAGHGLPPAAAVGLDGAGRAALGPVLWSVARWPRQIPDLLRLALETRRALQALRRGVRALSDERLLGAAIFPDQAS